MKTLRQIVVLVAVVVVLLWPGRAAIGEVAKAWPDPKLMEELARKRVSYRFRESDVPKYVLPEVLTCADGTRVGTKEQWEAKRRAETLELFRTHVYGRSPGAGKVSFE